LYATNCIWLNKQRLFQYQRLAVMCSVLLFWDKCRTVCAIALHRQTKTNTNPDPNRYRRRCPDPNARIQKFIHYMAVVRMIKYDDLSILPVISSGAELAGVRSDRSYYNSRPRRPSSVYTAAVSRTIA